MTTATIVAPLPMIKQAYWGLAAGALALLLAGMAQILVPHQAGIVVSALLGTLGAVSLLVGATRLQHALAEQATQATALSSKLAQAQSQIAALEAEQAEDRQRIETLLRETNHRIGNSLSTVSSLLGLQAIRARSEHVEAGLEAARSRVHAVASAHRRLRLAPGSRTLALDEFLEGLLGDLEADARASEAVQLHGEFIALQVSADDAVALSILVSELVSNAYRHAFPPGEAGTITVELVRDAAGLPELTVTDTGVGTGEDAAGPGLGGVVIKQLAQQFGGVPSYNGSGEGGLTVRVSLPKLGQVARPLAS